MPAAMPAPMIAPIEEPEMATGLMPSSSSASITWIWARPRAPPPPKATANVGSRPCSSCGAPLSVARSGIEASIAFLSAAVASLRTYHQYRRFRNRQTTGRRLDLIERHGVDVADPAVDVVYAAIVELQFDKRTRDGRRRIEIVDRICADQIGLGACQLFLGRPLLGHPAHHFADEFEGFLRTIGAG